MPEIILIILAIILSSSFVLYVVISLSTIKHQLKLLHKHLNVKNDEVEIVSNEEIIRELEMELNQDELKS